MTESSGPKASSEIEFIGDGETTQFTIPFTHFGEDDLEVRLNDNLLAWGYQLDGQTITFISAPKEGDRIKVTRFTQQQRATRFRPHHEFRADAINLELDRLLAMIQDLQRQLAEKSRSEPAAPQTSLPVLDPEQISLPKPEPGKVLGWTLSGKLGNFERQQAVASGASNRFSFLETIADGLSQSYGLASNLDGVILSETVQVFLDGVYQSKSSYRLIENAITFNGESVPPKNVQVAILYGIAPRPTSLQ